MGKFLPNLGNDLAVNNRRQASANQLKGFLMHFDQLLANYFSQLSHVKDLFSMNAEKDQFGNYIIGRTYYTQPLFDIVPDVDKLYIDKNGHKHQYLKCGGYKWMYYNDYVKLKKP